MPSAKGSCRRRGKRFPAAALRSIARTVAGATGLRIRSSPATSARTNAALSAAAVIVARFRFRNLRPRYLQSLSACLDRPILQEAFEVGG